MSPAAISHLPHLIAASLVNFVRDHDTRTELMKNLAAGGFKDITRIASSSPTMWQHICVKNRENISQILDSYIQDLTQVKELVDQADEQGIYHLFDSFPELPEFLPLRFRRAYQEILCRLLRHYRRSRRDRSHCHHPGFQQLKS